MQSKPAILGGDAWIVQPGLEHNGVSSLEGIILIDRLVEERLGVKHVDVYRTGFMGAAGEKQGY
ncbi:hypothetical protein D3C87_2115770 [compost metagenome]